MTVIDRPGTWCVIGAGPHGLAAVKAFRQLGLAVQGYEREPEVGGNWNYDARNSRVYTSTHLISSKPFTAYPDFPMPDDYPDYPSHRQVHAYLKRYADHFGLREVVAFSTDVERVEPVEGGTHWEVTVRATDGTVTTSRFDGVVVANGHNWNPKLPQYPGQDGFTGQILHSAGYKDPAMLRGKRVLVVGAGNTGCDLAVEAAQQAAQAFHSTRRGYYYNPKYVNGRPADQVADTLLVLRLPLPVRRFLFGVTQKVVVGDYGKFGLRQPDHKFFATHPIVNSLLVYYVGQGDIQPKPDIERFDGPAVVFTDGSRVEVDLVLFATGYLVRFDFLDAHGHLNWRDTHPHLYLHVFTPQHDNLFVAGLIQPDSGQWTLAHWQAMAIAGYVRARTERPDLAERFRELVALHADDRFSGGTTYTDSSRHYFEVAHQDYLTGLERAINLLEGSRSLAKAGR